MSSWFAHPGFLAAGALAALFPLALHLLTRDRVRRIDVPTLRFFAADARRRLERRNLRERLVVAMRMAVPLLLGVAFADPGRRPPPVPPAPPPEWSAARVVVVDRSASMGRPALASARAAALARAAELAQPSATAPTAVVAFDHAAETLSDGFTPDPDAFAAALERTVAGDGGTRPDEGIRLAGRLLEGVSAVAKTVVFVGDLQQRGWEARAGEVRLPPGVALTVVPVSAQAVDPGMGLVEADTPQAVLRDGRPRILAVRLRNYGVRERRDVPVSLFLDGRVEASQTVNLPARGDAVVRFRPVFGRDGDHPGWIAWGDGADAGSRHYFNVVAVPRVRVLVMNGRPSRRPAEDAAFFVRLALAPDATSPFEAATADAATVTVADLADVDAVVLAEVDRTTPAVRAALTRVAERGGGLLFLPGRCDAEAFAASFAGLSPCRLRKVVAPAAPMTLGTIDLEHPALSVFAPARHGDPGSLHFHRYWELADTQQARVSARFADGRPALLERDLGAGRTMLFAAPAVPSWTSLPHSALAVPLWQQLARHLAVRPERPTRFTVGDALDGGRPVSLSALAGDSRNDPPGKPFTAIAAPRAGLFRLSEADGGGALAVNRPSGEADPATVTPEELAATLEHPDTGQPFAEAHTPDAAGEATAAEAGTRTGWWSVILILAVWLIAEHALAARTWRH